MGCGQTNATGARHTSADNFCIADEGDDVDVIAGEPIAGTAKDLSFHPQALPPLSHELAYDVQVPVRALPTQPTPAFFPSNPPRSRHLFDEALSPFVNVSRSVLGVLTSWDRAKHFGGQAIDGLVGMATHSAAWAADNAVASYEQPRFWLSDTANSLMQYATLGTVASAGMAGASIDTPQLPQQAADRAQADFRAPSPALALLLAPELLPYVAGWQVASGCSGDIQPGDWRCDTTLAQSGAPFALLGAAKVLGRLDLINAEDLAFAQQIRQTRYELGSAMFDLTKNFEKATPEEILALEGEIDAVSEQLLLAQEEAAQGIAQQVKQVAQKPSDDLPFTAPGERAFLGVVFKEASLLLEELTRVIEPLKEMKMESGLIKYEKQPIRPLEFNEKSLVDEADYLNNWTQQAQGRNVSTERLGALRDRVQSRAQEVARLASNGGELNATVQSAFELLKASLDQAQKFLFPKLP